MTPPPDVAAKDALIATLLARIEALMAANARLTARVAELEAKLGLPPRTPDNSSVPPSKGQKPSESSTPKDKAKPHAGAHRPLHPNPTTKRDVFACRCQGCGADVSGVAQNPCEGRCCMDIDPGEGAPSPSKLKKLCAGGGRSWAVRRATCG